MSAWNSEIDDKTRTWKKTLIGTILHITRHSSGCIQMRTWDAPDTMNSCHFSAVLEKKFARQFKFELARKSLHHIATALALRTPRYKSARSSHQFRLGAASILAARISGAVSAFTAGFALLQSNWAACAAAH